MKLLLVYMLVLSLCGCTRKYVNYRCNSPDYLEENKNQCYEYSELKASEFAGVPWPMFFLLPIDAVAGSGSSQRSITSDPNYQAGGSSYKDYTQPQNQPQPQPSYQQQQINNGNGAGQYGNYPKY